VLVDGEPPADVNFLNDVARDFESERAEARIGPGSVETTAFSFCDAVAMADVKGATPCISSDGVYEIPSFAPVAYVDNVASTVVVDCWIASNPERTAISGSDGFCLDGCREPGLLVPRTELVVGLEVWGFAA
jgi:hypothetical protein